MRMYDIIHKKRNGYELSKEEIDFFIKGYTDGSIPDYQASALCMAIFFSGMTEEETVNLTQSMAHSGDTLDLSQFGNLTVDKHSTGGVGDKTSLIICPIVSSLGGKLAKMSGRGLGHTGGTIDKLESIPGYKTTLGIDEFLKQVDEIGLSVIGQSSNLTPADKKLYALRDVTATVDSIPLITSSVMSKKLAAGSKNIVLDVTVGSGAFMKDVESAKYLAQNMVKIGKSCSRNITAVLSNMDVPLGCNIGNSLEVIEAVEILKNNKKGDLYDVCVSLASEMTSLLKNISPNDARALVVDAIESGKAFEKMKEWINYQGGDSKYLDDTSLFDKAKYIEPVISQSSGYISHMDTESIGICASILGAGRIAKEDIIDFSAGVVLNKKTGDYVEKGDVLAYLHTNKQDTCPLVKQQYLSAITFTDIKPNDEILIYDYIR